MNLQIDIKMHTKILREKNNIVSYTINVFPNQLMVHYKYTYYNKYLLDRYFYSGLRYTN